MVDSLAPTEWTPQTVLIVEALGARYYHHDDADLDLDDETTFSPTLTQAELLGYHPCRDCQLEHDL